MLFRSNERMLAWSRELRAAGIRTAILSNMPQPLLDLMRADPGFDWLREFDVLLFSCEVRLVKPEAGIYRRLLALLAVEPAHCVFLDDNAGNAAAARAVGIQGFHCRSDEDAARAAESLGLPGEALRGL